MKNQEKKPAGEKKNIIGTVVKYVTAVLVVLVLFWFGFICQVRLGRIFDNTEITPFPPSDISGTI